MTKMSLPAAPYLVSLDEEKSFVEAELRCACGCDTFRIFHNGKVTPALLGGWWTSWFRRKKPGLLIEARCSACGLCIPLHCSQRDGDGWWPVDAKPETEFIHPRLHDQRVRIGVGYSWRDEDGEPLDMSEGWTAGYADFYLDAWNDEHPKKMRIYEEE